MDRLQELDVLRGFAALNVLLYHYTFRYFEIFKIGQKPRFEWFFGHHGVELFFMISGFVIFLSLHKIKDVKEFILKRFIRLYPAYWICITITLLFSVFYNISRGGGFSILEILMNFTMLQGIFEVPNIDGVYWSLLPELFFYALMAFLYFFRLLSNFRTISIIWLFWMVLNKSGIFPYGEFFLNLKYGMFFIAGIIFYNIKYKKINFLDYVILLMSLLTAIYINGYSYNIIVYIIWFSIFFLFVKGKLKVLIWKPLLFLGSISYPLYLLHQNIGYALIEIFHAFIPNYFILILATSAFMFFIAWLVMNYLEKPLCLFLKQKLLSNSRLVVKPQLS